VAGLLSFRYSFVPFPRLVNNLHRWVLLWEGEGNGVLSSGLISVCFSCSGGFPSRFFPGSLVIFFLFYMDIFFFSILVGFSYACYALVWFASYHGNTYLAFSSATGMRLFGFRWFAGSISISLPQAQPQEYLEAPPVSVAACLFVC